jgi:hypothetical protein
MQQPQEPPKLYDIYGVYYEPWFLQPWFLWTIMALIVGGVSYLIYRWYSNRAKPEIPYWQETLDQIELLELSDFSAHKEFYALLTVSLKFYLQHRFDIFMAGATDDECLHKLKEDKFVPNWVYEDVKQMFDGVMFVKFANAHAGENRMMEDVKIFRALVEKTKQDQKKEAP